MEFDWEYISDTLARAAEVAEKRKLMEIVDMLSDAFDVMETIPQDEDHYAIAVQFCKRITERVKTMGNWIKPNRITEESDYFVISNYSFPMYLWSVRNGFTYELDNLRIKVLKSKLTSKGLAAFRKKVQ